MPTLYLHLVIEPGTSGNYGYYIDILCTFNFRLYTHSSFTYHLFFLVYFGFCLHNQSNFRPEQRPFLFFFLSGFSLTNIHESQDCRGRGGYSFKSSLPLPPASLHCCRELTYAHSQQPDSNREPLASEHKSQTTKRRVRLSDVPSLNFTM